ncbi:MAG: 50S ribosomal protein L9 [Chlamydiae bacterium]|nr:50S ribosomal protein L9 [Chlamydiota bacterium]
MKQQLLLLDDVDGLGREGDVVTAKPGFVRNYLLPKKKAVVANKNSLMMRAKLQAEREKTATVDRKDSEALAAKLIEVVLKTEVNVDSDGKMYGSVTVPEIVRLLGECGYSFERRQVLLPYAIKSLGKHTINLRLRENVAATVSLEVQPEGGKLPEKREEPKVEEKQEEEPGE